jgi:hypothetical protein
MSPLVQQVTVAMLVLGAGLFSAWRLAGASTRMHILQWLVANVARSGQMGDHFRKQLEKHQSATGCSACGSRSDVGNKANRL